MILQRVVRLQQIYVKYFKKIRFNYILENRRSISNFSNSFKAIPELYHNHISVPYITFYSTSAVSHSEELVDANLFEKVCEETLESLTDHFEELVESREVFKNADISYSSGVLTVHLGNNFGTYVINRQSPNRQIWLSSPTSGPKRYDYVVDGKYWVYKHDMVPLHKLLQNEISNILGEQVDFSKCLYSKF